MDDFSDQEAMNEYNDPRLFVFNFTTGSVSAAYGTVIVLAIAFAIAAIGGLLYHGLQSMATGGYAYGQDTYNYKRWKNYYG